MRPLLVIGILVQAALGTLSADSIPEGRADESGWLCFRGSRQMTGQSSATLPAEPMAVWSASLDDSFESTAAIADGVVYLPSILGRCYAFDLETGSRKWTYQSPEEDPSKSSPCIFEDFVIYGDEIGNLRALRREDGELAWTFTVQAEIVSSPTLIGDRLIFGAYDNYLYCLNPKTGEEIWKVETEGPVHCSPTQIGNDVAVAGCDGFIRFVSIESGEESRAVEIGGNIASTPCAVGSRLFLGTVNESVIAIDSLKRSVVWEYRDPRRAFPFHSSAGVYEDMIIIGGRDKGVHALGQGDGKERWVFRTKSRVDSSPVIVGDRIFIGSSDGNIYGLDGKTGRKSWEYLLGGAVISSPAVASGKLVIATTEGVVTCFGEKASP